MRESEMLIDLAELPGAIWDRLQRAASTPHYEARLLTVAFIAENGGPDARILFLRGADRENDRIWFYGDARSGKMAQFKHDPCACAVLYEHHEGIQIRLYGRVELHCNDQTAREHWAQLDFVVKHELSIPPGVSGEERDPVRRKHFKAVKNDAHVEEGFANFTVLEMDVETIDWLQVSRTEERRARLTLSEDWMVQELSA